MVRIERLEEQHFALVAEWMSVSESNKYLDSELRGKSADERLIAIMCMNPKTKIYLVYKGDVPVGVVGLWKIDTVDQTASVFTLLGDRKNGRGNVMPVAGRLLAREAFTKESIETLYAAVMTPNFASRLVTRAMGFQHIGTWPKSAVLDDQRVDRELYYMDLQSLIFAEQEAGDSE